MGFIIGQPIPIRYYHGISGATVLARVVDEVDGAFGAELTLVENAALLALGYPGFYENTYTPDQAGHWKVLFKVGGTVYGQVFFYVGGGLTLQEQADVEAEAVDALESLGWDAALATILDNFTALRIGYLDELDFDLQGYLDALDALLDGIIADIGVFPTANYATIAAYVEDIRTRLTTMQTDVDDIPTNAEAEALIENATDVATTHDIQIGDGVGEVDIVEIAKAGIYDLAITMDLDALNTAAEGGIVVFRVYEKTDGANYADSPIGYAEWTDGDDFYPSFMVFMAHQFTKITVQCGVAVTAQRDIVVRYKVRDLGA